MSSFISSFFSSNLSFRLLFFFYSGLIQNSYVQFLGSVLVVVLLGVHFCQNDLVLVILFDESLLLVSEFLRHHLDFLDDFSVDIGGFVSLLLLDLVLQLTHHLTEHRFLFADLLLLGCSQSV